MKHKLQFVLLLISVCFLTACSPLKLNHVIINESKTTLEVEYEYVIGMRREDSSELDKPVKTTSEQYEKSGVETAWNALSAENGYELESVSEETINNPNTNEQMKKEDKKVKIKLLPGEVLRVFVSTHLNGDRKSVKRISLRGENGKLEIEGAGFDQFSDYRPDRFFTDTKDYRIVYR